MSYLYIFIYIFSFILLITRTVSVAVLILLRPNSWQNSSLGISWAVDHVKLNFELTMLWMIRGFLFIIFWKLMTLQLNCVQNKISFLYFSPYDYTCFRRLDIILLRNRLSILRSEWRQQLPAACSMSFPDNCLEGSVYLQQHQPLTADVTEVIMTIKIKS